MSGYSSREVAELLQLPVTRVRAFARAGLTSTQRGAQGEYRFSFQDIVLLRTAKALTSARIPSRRLWRALRALKEQLPRGQSLSTLRIVADGDRVLVRERDAAWHPESGQAHFDFSVGELAREVAPLTREAAQAAEVESSGSEDWYRIALDFEAEAAVEDAEAAYRHAIEREPGHAEAHINLGHLLQQAGRAEEAEHHYRRAWAAAPAEPLAPFNLGTVLEDLGRGQEAMSAYGEALRLDPELADAHYNLAGLHERAGDRAAALRHWARYRALAR